MIRKKKYTHNFIKKMKIDRFDNKELEYVYFLHLLISLFTFFSSQLVIILGRSSMPGSRLGSSSDSSLCSGLNFDFGFGEYNIGNQQICIFISDSTKDQN